MVETFRIESPFPSLVSCKSHFCRPAKFFAFYLRLPEVFTNLVLQIGTARTKRNISSIFTLTYQYGPLQQRFLNGNRRIHKKDWDSNTQFFGSADPGNAPAFIQPFFRENPDMGERALA